MYRYSQLFASMPSATPAAFAFRRQDRAARCVLTPRALRGNEFALCLVSHWSLPPPPPISQRNVGATDERDAGGIWGNSCAAATGDWTDVSIVAAGIGVRAGERTWGGAVAKEDVRRINKCSRSGWGHWRLLSSVPFNNASSLNYRILMATETNTQELSLERRFKP